jgi:hypothetical protein
MEGSSAVSTGGFHGKADRARLRGTQVRSLHELR